MKTKLVLMLAFLTTAGTPVMSQDVKTDETKTTLETLQEEVASLKSQQRSDRLDAALKSRQERIWPKSSPIIVTYGAMSLKDVDNGVQFKSEFSVGLSKRKTYYLHKKAIAGMLKIGVDLTWFEVSVARYAKGKGVSTKGMMSDLMGNVTGGTYDSFEDYFDKAYNSAQGAEERENISDMINRIDIGKYQVAGSMLALGPNVRVAPFYPIGKKWLDNIKVSAYFHYVPTYSALIFTGDDSPTVCGGYISNWRYGLNISFGRFGLGFERQWGEGTLKKFNIDDDDDSDFSISSEKRKYRMATTRFYVGLRF